MENEQPEKSSNETSSTESDWESRTLCSDGNCIGVIGPDGRCKECGKPYDSPAIEGESFEDEPFEDDAYDPDEEYDEEYDEDYDEEEDTIENSDTSGDLDWENRRLCSDGNCIGVIGPDGRCKECGKRFKG